MGARTAEERVDDQEKRRDNRRRQLVQINESVDAYLEANGKVPSWVEGHVEKARKGNVKAMIALNCADCVCFVKSEIRDCEMTHCPLHPLRPYK